MEVDYAEIVTSKTVQRFLLKFYLSECSMIKSGIYFELSESVDTLKSLQKERLELVRFNVDRWEF